MIDLDGLKAANDRFGHDSGDRLLRAVGDVMRGDVRATDMPARYAGDEFVLILPETDITGAALVAEKIRVDISRIALSHDRRSSARQPRSAWSRSQRTAARSAELMRRADLAMYEAKRRGRDQIVRFARQRRPAASAHRGDPCPPPSPPGPASQPRQSSRPAPWETWPGIAPSADRPSADPPER